MIKTGSIQEVGNTTPSKNEVDILPVDRTVDELSFNKYCDQVMPKIVVKQGRFNGRGAR